jgi:hypothetical protein
MTSEDAFALTVVTVINCILAMFTYGHVAEMRHILRAMQHNQGKTGTNGEGQS